MSLAAGNLQTAKGFREANVESILQARSCLTAVSVVKALKALVSLHLMFCA